MVAQEGSGGLTRRQIRDLERSREAQTSTEADSSPLTRRQLRMAITNSIDLAVVSDEILALRKNSELPETSPVEVITESSSSQALESDPDPIRDLNHVPSIWSDPVAPDVPAASLPSWGLDYTEEKPFWAERVADEAETSSSASLFSSTNSFSPTATSALIVSAPNRPTEMITETGDVLLTNTVDLPRSLGQTGGLVGLMDSPEAYKQPEEPRPPSSMPPVSASRAVSALGPPVQMFVEPKKRGFLKIGVPILFGSITLVAIGLFIMAISLR